MKIVGLTGGIATGKSTASRVFRNCGAAIVDADQLAHEAVLPGQPGWQAVVDHFGESIIAADGAIDRPALGKIVFADAVQRQILNDIVHPFVFAEMGLRVARMQRKGLTDLVVLDIPLLFETGMAHRICPVVLVYASPEQQLERLIRRDGLAAKAARNRIQSQIPIHDKRPKADFIIDNSGSPEHTIFQSEKLYRQLVGTSEEKTPSVIFRCHLFDHLV